jgi:hypothetical protein
MIKVWTTTMNQNGEADFRRQPGGASPSGMTLQDARRIACSGVPGSSVAHVGGLMLARSTATTG